MVGSPRGSRNWASFFCNFLYKLVDTLYTESCDFHPRQTTINLQEILLKNYSGIYKIEINDKVYIGSAVNIKHRWETHKNTLKNNKHENKFLQNAWNKYESVYFEIICNCPILCLLGMEQYYISKYFDNQICCFNISPTAGNTLGKSHTTETKIKLSEIGKTKIGKLNSFYNKKHSTDSLRKMSDIKKGKIPSNETRQKMSEAHSGAKHPLYNKHHTEEAKLKMSQSSKGNKNCVGRVLSEETKLKISLAHLNNHKKEPVNE